MDTLVLLALERQGTVVPICRSRCPAVVRYVAQAALSEAQEAASEPGNDEVLVALLRQEAERLKKALTVLGLAPGLGLNPEGG